MLAHLQHSLGLLHHTSLLLPFGFIVVSNQLVLGEVFNLQDTKDTDRHVSMPTHHTHLKHTGPSVMEIVDEAGSNVGRRPLKLLNIAHLVDSVWVLDLLSRCLVDRPVTLQTNNGRLVQALTNTRLAHVLRID